MRRPPLPLHTLAAALLLLTISATASAQVREPDVRPTPDHDPHPPAARPGLVPNPVTDSPSMPIPERQARARAALRTADRAYRSGQALYTIAADAYREAAQLDPEDERAYIGLGNVYAGWKRYDIAAGMYARAAEIKPKSAEAHYGLGAAYHAQGKKYAAREEYKILQRLNKKKAAQLAELLNRGETQ